MHDVSITFPPQFYRYIGDIPMETIALLLTMLVLGHENNSMFSLSDEFQADITEASIYLLDSWMSQYS